jgi:hypothetical protein
MRNPHTDIYGPGRAERHEGVEPRCVDCGAYWPLDRDECPDCGREATTPVGSERGRNATFDTALAVIALAGLALVIAGTRGDAWMVAVCAGILAGAVVALVRS